jgi:hypothetical protein
VNRTTISLENEAHLLRKGWLATNQTTNTNTATWRDLFTTDGEFNVYRYQSFSFAVGGALLIAGVVQLSSFEIPTTLLGILGLSQAVYIGGKLVTPTAMAELKKIIGDMRDAERKFVDTATAANNNVAPTTLAAAMTPASHSSYDAYMKLATTRALSLRRKLVCPSQRSDRCPRFDARLGHSREILALALAPALYCARQISISTVSEVHMSPD